MNVMGFSPLSQINNSLQVNTLNATQIGMTLQIPLQSLVIDNTIGLQTALDAHTTTDNLHHSQLTLAE